MEHWRAASWAIVAGLVEVVVAIWLWKQIRGERRSVLSGMLAVVGGALVLAPRSPGIVFIAGQAAAPSSPF